MTGERSFLMGSQIKELQKALADGWKFDPWLNPTGRPQYMREPTSDMWDMFWVIVKGTDDEIMAMNPIFEIPTEEVAVVPADPGYVGLHTVKVLYDKTTGKPLNDPPEGYVILHKDHIAATGTVYTRLPMEGAEQILDSAKNFVQSQIDNLLKDKDIELGFRNTLILEFTRVQQSLDPRQHGGPWCVDCISVPLRPIYSSGYMIQGYECPECGRSYPMGGPA